MKRGQPVAATTARLTRLEPTDAARPRRAACVFDHTAAFPASTHLEFSVSADEAVTQGALVYTLEILPVLFQYDKGDEIAFPVEKPDEEAIAAWADDKLLGFVDTYFRLSETDVYQQDNLVVDPVCGKRLNNLVAGGQEVVHGQTFYFCMEQCRQKFLEDTSRYADAKSRETRGVATHAASGDTVARSRAVAGLLGRAARRGRAAWPEKADKTCSSSDVPFCTVGLRPCGHRCIGPSNCGTA